MKKIFALLLAVVMVLSMAACAGSGNPGSTTAPNVDDSTTAPDATEAPDTEVVLDPSKYEGIEDYDELSAAIYEDVLGEFKSYYDVATAEITNVSLRYALMAIAEAKLMESAIMLPTTTQGGNYAIGRIAPYTAGGNALWGNDSERYHQALVTTEPITAAHRDEMKAKYAELRGTGTWEAWAKEFLTGNGYTLKDSYIQTYTSDPNTWDALTTSKAVDSEAIINTYDGLMEYDTEGTLQPALAESYTVSDDGMTYTFKLRQGVKWVDSQGREVAEVKADDFVAGMQHALDSGTGGLGWLVSGVIVNVTEYNNGDVLDFAEVGVKAVDDYTVEYTLCQPASYFPTMLGYGIFAPMCRSYYLSKGGQFGADFDAEAESYSYGETPDDIAYCGPYLVTNATSKNTIVFSANPTYWNKDNINVKTITWLYNDGSDATKSYEDMKAGTIDGAGLNSSTVELAKTDGLFDTLAYRTSTNATSYMAFYNVNREVYANVADGAAASPKTDAQKADTYAALLNVHFRRAISMALDRATWNAQSVGEELALVSLRNSYTPGTFVSLSEEVTVQINGVDKTYPAGTQYGQIMQDQIDADGVALKVWDPTADSGIGSSDGFDGWYNVDAAKAELQKAVEQLATIGVTVSKENPITIDLPYPSFSTSYSNRAQVYKQSLESTLDGLVVVNLVDCKTADEWYYAGYDTTYGNEANYDMYDLSGWGPDYGDPKTYLDTFLPDYSGYMAKCIGIF